MSKPGNAQSSCDPGVLVVRLGSMGDVIHALPAVASLKHSFPGSQSDLGDRSEVGLPAGGQPLCGRRDPCWTGRTLAGIGQAWRELARAAFSIRGGLPGALQVRADRFGCARADRIYGFHQCAGPRARGGSLLLEPSADRSPRTSWTATWNWPPRRAPRASSARFPPAGRRRGGELPEGDFVLASPARGLGRQSSGRSNTTPLLAGLLRPETRLAAGVERSAAGVDGPEGWPSGGRGPHLRIPGLIHATRRATAVVGIDSGPLHLAAALDKPGVAIFGPTDPARNGPYGKIFAVLRDAGAVTSYKTNAGDRPQHARHTARDGVRSSGGAAGRPQPAADHIA